MKNCVGQAVRGDNFWNRANELEDIWEKISTGSNILLSAPRRVGKTSIMFHLQDNPKENYIVIYINTESADSENEFWSKVFNALLEEEFVNKLKAHSQTLWQKIKNIKINKISTSGVEFGDGEKLDYLVAFEKLLNNIESEKKLILMIDEFAQTVENIIKYENESSAEKFLQRHRELRQNENLLEKISFIYAGSIGLESIASKLNGIKYINDLNSIKIKPLTLKDAKRFIEELSKSLEINLDENVIDYLLEKIEWLIPFYIQLILQEVKTISRVEEEKIISDKMIDEAIKNSLEHKNHFEHWRIKLKEALSIDEFKLAKEILNIIAENNTIDFLDIINIGTKHNTDDERTKEIIHTLIYDGYINNNDNPKIYRFNSPILRMWWYKNVAN
ncbi:ATP-binding protein [Aliarcobacter butzleri]|uniref:ATP-binding protein n=1 Tax=Aliarcobacter butzleri TaxID=28197 RepID=UPI0021B31B11|nr:ATP-binding protein [Aliarcobacter butzleri]MCT7617551.1 ATP-binding protein [Aliarcobacter butzleri]